MKKYAWPGNIRELENRIKKAVVLADKPLLGPDDLDLKPENLDADHAPAPGQGGVPERYINEVLARNNGNRTKTAKDLGVDPRTIFRHLEKLEAEKTGKPLPPEEDELHVAAVTPLSRFAPVPSPRSSATPQHAYGIHSLLVGQGIANTVRGVGGEWLPASPGRHAAGGAAPAP